MTTNKPVRAEGFFETDNVGREVFVVSNLIDKVVESPYLDPSGEIEIAEMPYPPGTRLLKENVTVIG